MIEGVLQNECQKLIRGFQKKIKTGLPWVKVKTAHLPDGSMIPPSGQKTFTSENALRLAHQMRRESDAILTGSGTVLSDWPEFTVRKVSDHPRKKRDLIVLDRRKRVSKKWVQQEESFGLKVWQDLTFEALPTFFEKTAHLEVLVEAGPSLTQSFLTSELWDEHIQISMQPNGSEKIQTFYRENDVYRNH